MSPPADQHRTGQLGDHQGRQIGPPSAPLTGEARQLRRGSLADARARIFGAAARHGVLDGLWTFLVNVGSKSQMIALIAVASRAYGVSETGCLLLAVATATLVTTGVDAGLTPQVTRLYASRVVVGVRPLLNPVLSRMLAAGGIGIAAGWLAQHGSERALYGVTTAAYAVALVAGRVLVAGAYGLGAFRAGSTALGVSRLCAIPLTLVVGAAGLAAPLLLVPLAAGELGVAWVATAVVRSASGQGPTNAMGAFNLRSTFVFGLGGLANAVANRSDAVLASITLTSSGLGIYSTASQVQGALSTTALIPAGALVTYVARRKAASEGVRTLTINAAMVASLYSAMAVAVWFTSPLWQPILLGHSHALPRIILYLTLASGLFSCLGGVATFYLTGAGRQAALVAVWCTVLAVAVCAFLVGGTEGGVTGVASAALIRDGAFLAIGGLLCWRAVK